jgi:hypothetical protein
MATSRSTMSAGARSIHPAIINAAISAEASHKRIQRISSLLTDLMQEIHGGNWQYSISHEPDAEFILVAVQPGDEPQVRPVPEIA